MYVLLTCIFWHGIIICEYIDFTIHSEDIADNKRLQTAFMQFRRFLN